MHTPQRNALPRPGTEATMAARPCSHSRHWHHSASPLPSRPAQQCRTQWTGPTRLAQPGLVSRRQPLRTCSAATAMTAAAAAPQAAGPLVWEGWTLWALLALGGALAQVSQRWSWGQALSSPLVAMAWGVVLTAVGVLPTDCPSFDVVWQYLMPMAASCFMLESDLSQLAVTGGPTFVAFLVGAVGMVLGAVVGWTLLSQWMGPEGGKLAACLCASYVGGSVNFAAVSKAVALPAAVVPAAMAVDNLAMAGFLAVLSAVPGPTDSPTANRLPTVKHDPTSSSSTDRETASSSQIAASTPMVASGSRDTSSQSDPRDYPATPESIALTLAASALACAAAKQIATHLNVPSLYLMIMAGITAGFAALGQRCLAPNPTSSGHSAPTTSTDRKAFQGATALGGALMSVFFVVIGCSAGSLDSLARPEALGMLGFLIVMVSTHWVFMLLANLALRLPVPALVLGSNCNVGGPATAAAMAASKGWTALIQPAMLSGSTGYALGTLAGLAVARSMGLIVA